MKEPIVKFVIVAFLAAWSGGHGLAYLQQGGGDPVFLFILFGGSGLCLGLAVHRYRLLWLAHDAQKKPGHPDSYPN